MKVSEVLIRIKNAINEPDDLTGKASNVLFKNSLIVEQLKNSLDLYAANVKGIEAIHSVPMGNNVRLGVGPTDMIRGQGYKFVYLYNGTMKYELKYLNIIEANRIYDMSNISGIPESYTVWNKEISIYPLNSFTAKTTQLNGGINSADTTITARTDDQVGAPNVRKEIPGLETDRNPDAGGCHRHHGDQWKELSRDAQPGFRGRSHRAARRF